MLGAFLVAACSTQNNTEPEDMKADASAPVEAALISLNPTQIKSAGIELGQPQMRKMNQTLSLTGSIASGPDSKASVSVAIGGTVQQILVHPTNSVRKGQVLAVLSHPDYVKLQETYLSAVQNLRFLEKEYQRQQELVNAKAGTEKVLQRAETDFRAEQARLSSLEAQLRLLGIDPDALAKKNTVQSSINVISPIDGKVEHIAAQIGAYIQPGTEIFSLVSNSHLHVELLVYERDLSKIKTGQAFSFSPVNAPDQSYKAKVFGLGSMIDPSTKTISVHAEVLNGAATLVPGMMVNAKLAVGEANVLTVPDAALILAGDAHLVFVHKGADAKGNALFEPQPVQVGTSADGFTEISFNNPQKALPTVAQKGAFFIHAQKAVSEGGED